jgi:hypothetical protein
LNLQSALYLPVALKLTARVSEAGQGGGFSHSRRMSHLAGNWHYEENDGRLEHAQQMAAHESRRTTKLYDRTKDEITLSEVEAPKKRGRSRSLVLQTVYDLPPIDSSSGCRCSAVQFGSSVCKIR